ncbi:hypothetical protein NU219Hw_g8733t1 [Hortaea werneckii]
MTVNTYTAADTKSCHAKQLDQNIPANLEIMKTGTAASKMKKFGPTLTTEEEFPRTPCSFHLRCLGSLMSFQNKHTGSQAKYAKLKMKISIPYIRSRLSTANLSESDLPETEASKAVLDDLQKVSLPYPLGGLYGGQYCPPRIRNPSRSERREAVEALSSL